MPTTLLFSVFLLTRFPQGGNGIFFCYFAPVWALGTRRNCDPGWETQESNFLELRTIWEPPKMCPPYHATCRSQHFFRIKSNSLRAGNRISLRFWAAFGSECLAIFQPSAPGPRREMGGLQNQVRVATNLSLMKRETFRLTFQVFDPEQLPVVWSPEPGNGPGLGVWGSGWVGRVKE